MRLPTDNANEHEKAHPDDNLLSNRPYCATCAHDVSENPCRP